VFGRAHRTVEVAWTRFTQRREGVRNLTTEELLEQYHTALEESKRALLVQAVEQQRLERMGDQLLQPSAQPASQLPQVNLAAAQRQHASELSNEELEAQYIAGAPPRRPPRTLFVSMFLLRNSIWPLVLSQQQQRQHSTRAGDSNDEDDSAALTDDDE